LNKALGPNFQKITLEKIDNSYFMIEFDETAKAVLSLLCHLFCSLLSNSESKKELQIRICFWSEKMNQVVETHLKNCFLGHAAAEACENVR